MTMTDRAIAAALAVLVLVARVAFAAQTLWAWDSVLYARALEQGFSVGVDLADQRPHPPGYLFYLGVVALIRFVTRDSNAALVAVSVIASALTAAAVYLLCRRWADRALAAVIALGAASAPLVWTYGEVAMPYAVLGLLSVVLAASLREARSRPWPAALVASAALVARVLARRRPGGDAAFFALWLAPAALVYVTIHIGDPGYLMSVLPGLYVACAALLAPTAAKAPRAALAFAALLVAINIAVFVVSDAPFSARAIASHDRSLEQRVAFVRAHFTPASTAILAQSEYLTARYYLPEFRVRSYGSEPEVLSRARQ